METLPVEVQTLYLLAKNFISIVLNILIRLKETVGKERKQTRQTNKEYE